MSRSAAALLLCLIAGCNAASGDSAFFGTTTPPEGQVLRYITGSEPESLDPQLSSGQPELRIYMALYDALVEFDPKTGQPIPSLARSWEINGNASEILFHMRSNARFSNGDTITANDFVYTFRRSVSPALASRSAYLAYEIKYAKAYNEGADFVRDSTTGQFVVDPEARPDGSGEASTRDTPFHSFMHSPERLVVPGDDSSRTALYASKPGLRALVAGKQLVPVRAEDIGVEAINDSTLRITLEEPAPYFVGLLTNNLFRLVPRKAVEKYGNQWTKPQNIITSGPFNLVSHKPYNELVVRRNPMYWDAASVKLDEISFYPIEDQTTMMNLYKSGEVDATYNHTVPASWLKSGLREKKDYMDAPENATEYYMINTTKAPMNDVRVRKAFNMAIDKNALARYRVVQKPLTAFTPEGIYPGYPRPKGDQFDPAHARELLAEAGYRDASGKFDPKRFPVGEVAISYNTSESNKQVAEFVQAQWKQNLGLTVPLNNSEWKTYLNSRSKLDYKGFARAGWIGDYLDPNTFLSLFSTAGGDNGTGWFDKKYVAMLTVANSQPNQAERFRLLAKAEAYMLDAQPVIPLTTAATSFMKKPYVKGMYPNPATAHTWKYVYIEHDPAKWDYGIPDMTSPSASASPSSAPAPAKGH